MRITPQMQLKINRLAEHRVALEKEDIIKELPAFDLLTVSEVQKRRSEWQAYYAKVRTGKAAALLEKSKEAYRAGDMMTVAENGLKARKALAEGWSENLGEPKYRDPDEFHFSSTVSSYRHVCEVLAELEGARERAPF